VISNLKRVVGDVDYTMADSNIAIVNSVSSSQSSSSQGSPVTKKAKPSALDITEEDIRERNIDDEVEAYFHEKVCLCKTNILEWLRTKEPRFLDMSQLAKVVIGIPATSTPSERLSLLKLQKC